MYTGTDAGTLTASVKAGETAISDATVTWSSSNEGVATIASDGTVTLVAAGSTTITASYAGVEGQYQASYDTYELTVTSSAPVIDYATLPFNWEGGTSNELTAMSGVTGNSLGDYAAGNAPYRVQFNADGDYIQVKTDGQPGKVTIGVKMIGGANTSSITVQGSSDGEIFKDIETLSISGNQNDELTLTTTKGFEETDRYVRLVFTKGSNVGVGPITIAKPLSKHTATFYINGESSTAEVAEGSAITFPAVPDDINGKSFVGWITNTIDGTTNTAPAFVTSASMGNSDVTYYAVFAIADATGESVETKTQTLQYDTWTYSGTTTDKSSYRLFGNDSYIESISFDLSKLSKVIVYGGTYGGGGYNSLTIGDGTNIWKSVTVSGSSQTGTNTYTDGTSLTGTNKLRITATAGDGKLNGLRISKVEIFTNEPSIVYSDYCTTVVAPVKPAKPIVFHDGGEGVSYEGELTVPMFAEEGATIYYTTDDTEPTAASTEYTKPLNISTNTTLKAIAVKDGVESDVVTREYRIEAVDAPDINLDGYYSIKNNNGNYVNVAGRKTVTFVDKNTSKTAAGTVIRVKTTNGKVEVLRSQGVDVPRYAERAMSYVPELVKELMKRLSENVENPIIGEDGANLITDEVMDLDYNLYLEEADGGYRIYGKTPSMQRVVDFYATNKTIIDERLPKVEGFVEEILLKVAKQLGHENSPWASKFKIHDIWKQMVKTNPDLTEPVEDNEAAISQFYTEILSSEANVWNFAHETMMIYWEKVMQYIGDNFNGLGDYGKYLEKVPNILPNFKYYIVSNKEGNGIDFISEGNEDIIKDAERTVWTLEGRENFKVTFDVVHEGTIYSTVANQTEPYTEYLTTLYTDFAYDLPEDGNVKAYKISSIDETTGVAKKEEITGTIPAQTPVLLISTAENATLKLNTADGTAIESELKGADYFINKYNITSTTAEGILNALKSLSESLYNDYVYLQLKNSGTVNNKYFFGLDAADIEKCSVKNDNDELDCVIRNLYNDEQLLGFFNTEQALANKAFLESSLNPVKLFLIGDVNRDGKVSIADVTALVNIILGKAKYPDDADKYDFEAANVNLDNKISIADVTALVNIILGK